jgi:uncharacterized repeat protein (TIGR02059 family)
MKSYVNKFFLFLAFFIAVVFNISFNKAEAIATVTTIPVGDYPNSSTLVGTNLYVNNAGSDEISVIDTTTNTVTDTISVGDNPGSSVLLGTNLYINNRLSNEIYVINTTTNTVTDTIAVGSGPWTSALVGTNLYVNNRGAGNVSVINTNTNAVTDTITVGTNPWFPIVVGTKIYTDNYGSNNVSVIDTGSNTVTTTIAVGNNPWASTLVGTNLYVNNYTSGTVSVINTNTDTVTDTINVGSGPLSSVLVGTDLYVVNNLSDNVSVIDTNSKLVSATISVGARPQSATLLGANLYVNNFSSNTVSVIDINTNTVTDIISVGSKPGSSTSVGASLYVNNTDSDNVTVIDGTAPVFSSATVNNSTLTLTYNEALDETSIPDTGDFSVSVNGDSAIISGVVVTGSTVVLTLMDPVLFGEVVTVSYTTGAAPTRDVSLNNAASLINQVVTNNTVSQHSVIYISGSNGSIIGTLSQAVNDGEDAITVTAIPNRNYSFKNWSDGSTENPRTDTNVTGDISVTANFVKKPTAIGSYLADHLRVFVTTSTDTSMVTSTTKFIFSKTLKYLTTDSDVKELQKFLNNHGYQLTTTGVGSPGNETTKFGSLTKKAVIKFQLANNLVGDGIVGPKTNAVLNGVK